MKHPKLYTAQDIERYHQDEMPAAEMHALEKAALDDPFLSDALEGYLFTKNAPHDIASLENRLHHRIHKEEGKERIFFMNNKWMRIAALFLLFAGSGWLVFQTFSNKEMVTAATAPASAPVASEKSKPTDTVSIPAETFATTPPVVQNTKPVNSLPVKEPNKIASQEDFQSDQHIPEVASSRPLDDSLKNETYAAADMALRQKVMYDSDNIRSNAFAKEKLQIKVAGVKTDTIKNVDVVLQPTELSLSEVVVVNKNKGLAKPEAKRRQVVIDTLEPAEGWTNFDGYIANNMKMPEELKDKPVSGEVELTFQVNQHGEPINITVVKSLCEKCDEEAIRLLKEGPKWKNNKKKGKVKIKFPQSP